MASFEQSIRIWIKPSGYSTIYGIYVTRIYNKCITSQFPSPIHICHVMFDILSVPFQWLYLYRLSHDNSPLLCIHYSFIYLQVLLLIQTGNNDTAFIKVTCNWMGSVHWMFTRLNMCNWKEWIIFRWLQWIFYQVLIQVKNSMWLKFDCSELASPFQNMTLRWGSQ